MYKLSKSSGSKDSIFQIETIQHMSNELISLNTYVKSRGDSDYKAEITGAIIIEKISPFDTFIQVIEGMAEVVTDERSNLLEAGNSLIIPANTFYKEKGNEIFKMTLMRIKTEYKLDEKIFSSDSAG